MRLARALIGLTPYALRLTPALLLLAGTGGCGGGGGGGTPTTRRIAFVSDRDGNPEIYTVNADGSAPRRLTNNPSDDNSPCWSPDHQRLAFVSWRDGSAQIYLVKADGSGLLRLTQDAGPNAGPAWSPDGTRIAYVVGGQDIWVMNADGTNKVQLTTNAARDGGPAWSPDGARIYFVSNRDIPNPQDSGDNRSFLYVMDADGANQHMVGDKVSVDGKPCVSPDGTHIAYASASPDSPAEPDLYEANADGSAPTRVGPHNSVEPVWAPNGQTLTFTSFKDGNAELYSMAVNGSSLRRLTKNLAMDGGAAW
jgi:TolB protein